MSFHLYKQLDYMDCGPTCLRMVAKHYGKHYTAQTLREKSHISREGVSMLGLSEAAEIIGLKSIGVRITVEKLIEEAPLPCILHWEQNHFVVLYKIEHQSKKLSEAFLGAIKGGKSKKDVLETLSFEPAGPYAEINALSKNDKHALYFIADPARGLLTYSSEEFFQRWIQVERGGREEGLALLLEPNSKFYEEEDETSKKVNFSQLLFYVWSYKKLIVQLLLGMLVGSGISLILPFLTQSIVDVGIGTQDIPFIYLILTAQIVLLLSTASIDFIKGWILLHISTRLNLTILSEFLAKLMRLPVAFFDSKQFGDLMQRIDDHRRIETFLTGQTLNILFSLLNLVVFGIILSYFHFNIFCVAFTAAILDIGWIFLFLGSRKKLDTKRFDVSARNQSQIVQLIQGMQDIKLSGAETFKRWEWERTQAILFKWNIKSLSLTQFQQAGALLINQSKNVFVTFLAAKAVIEGEISLGTMMSIQYIIGQFNTPIEQMLTFLQSWQDAKMSLERLNEIHVMNDEEPANDVRRTEWSLEQDINFKNVSYSYPGAGNNSVLKNIDLTIPYGTTTAIVGTSGSGKTTLLKLLLRFYEPDKGFISIGTAKKTKNAEKREDRMKLFSDSSEELLFKNISQKAWRRACGAVMQDGYIYSDTIARNIAVNDEYIDQEKLFNASKLANVHLFVESLPLGYHTKIGAEGNGISQGQKQRILIARSIYKNPPLLLFDEATNALDSNNEAQIVENLKEFYRGRTVVIVAHRLSTVRFADKIVVLEKGEIVEEGTHRDLISLKGRYYKLISSQLELNQN